MEYYISSETKKKCYLYGLPEEKRPKRGPRDTHYVTCTLSFSAKGNKGTKWKPAKAGNSWNIKQRKQWSYGFKLIVQRAACSETLMNNTVPLKACTTKYTVALSHLFGSNQLFALLTGW